MCKPDFLYDFILIIRLSAYHQDKLKWWHAPSGFKPHTATRGWDAIAAVWCVISQIAPCARRLVGGMRASGGGPSFCRRCDSECRPPRWARWAMGVSRHKAWLAHCKVNLLGAPERRDPSQRRIRRWASAKTVSGLQWCPRVLCERDNLLHGRETLWHWAQTLTGRRRLSDVATVTHWPRGPPLFVISYCINQTLSNCTQVWFVPEKQHSVSWKSQEEE